jgi:hypothetical protein
VELDPELPLTLLDQKQAGKKLLLVTNSEWEYTRAMMRYAFDQFLPGGTTWRDLFELIVISARKPAFFVEQAPVFEVVSEDGMLRPSPLGIKGRGTYLGGNAAMVEEYLRLSGDEILYVGDHIYTDVHVSKSVLRWRTALVLRELEAELAALEEFEPTQVRLSDLMRRKEQLELQLSRVRLELQRRRGKYGPAPTATVRELDGETQRLREELVQLDEEIAPLARAAGRLTNVRWGPLMLAGNDKSHLARQVERYADIYTSRVSNFLFQTPFGYLRSPRGSLPHDAEPPLGAPE